MIRCIFGSAMKGIQSYSRVVPLRFNFSHL